MIGSFWNLCRACPSMPVDKLHSEYRSTYRWHEFTGNSRPEVVRRAPVPNQFGPTNEPPLPRRKKCPELAYKSHEFIKGSEQTSDSRNNVIANRARSEWRGTSSRRSKSEGPPAAPNGRAYPIASETDGPGVGNPSAQPGESSGLFKKTISKLSTEYRLQFVWPNVQKSIKGQSNDAVEVPKSQSMGAIKSSQTTSMPKVHKNRTTNQKEATVHELEPLVTDAEDKKPSENQTNIVEKKSVRPFSQPFNQDRNNHFLTKKENFGFEYQKNEKLLVDEDDNKQALVNGHARPDEWYKEVVELRKKAGEYKCRGWGTEIDPTLLKMQKELWDQVSKRSSLSALSLASSIHRPITKAEKEKENKKKFTPIKSTYKPRVPGPAYLMENKDESSLPARYSIIRHHLERTTGSDIEEGALLPSPTREKLMPAIPKSRESESQRGSPKKSAASRHESPQKGSPQKGSPSKTIKYDGELTSKDTGILISSLSPQPAPEINDEPIVKSPPEPTRVKSPEQIIMRSPDPVNWTVPLDTGKTFTVTQNVKEGENYSRPQSEIKASTPVEKPPPAPQSAPPELTEQARMDNWKGVDFIDPKSSGSPTGEHETNILSDGTTGGNLRFDKPIPESSLRCLDDPTLESDTSAITVRSNATDVLEKARDRFDRFWGGSKEDSV
ncbi:proteoglycan 4 isoform X10 [Eupeodes corollae]|uniref:proteoglycan 4 isoform X10 n=1 Tax=Eupeodes corollae TaxID=290404 RepID=UPI002492448D|nr:proteoglycan 4 isoform X10 [Eupeodes corollae]